VVAQILAKDAADDEAEGGAESAAYGSPSYVGAALCGCDDVGDRGVGECYSAAYAAGLKASEYQKTCVGILCA